MSQTQIDLRAPARESLSNVHDLPVIQAKRLVVVLQDAEQEAVLASRILALAAPQAMDVLLLGIAPEAENEARLRRKLARIAAFLTDAAPRTLSVETQIEQGRGWLEGVRRSVLPSDRLACCSDWSAGGLQSTLSDVLGETLRMPVYVFADLRDKPVELRQRVSSLTGWVLSLTSVGGFAVLAARIVLVSDGWLQSVLLLCALAVEIGVIYFVNSLFGWF